MKRQIAVFTLLGMLMSTGTALAVPDEYDDTQSHPLQLAAYLTSPIGYALEWAIFRPLHWVVSREGNEAVFSHGPHGQGVGPEDYGS